MTETVITIQQPKTTTTTTTTGQTSGGGIRINIGYFKTVPGILKLLQLFLGILCMALTSYPFAAFIHFFMFVAVTSFIATLLWTFAYFLSIRENLPLGINWILTELFNTGIVTIFYAIAFIVQLCRAPMFYPNGGNITAGVFGLFNTLAYLAGCYFLFIEHRAGNTQ